MNEDLKYYKLSGQGIEANIIVACKPDEVERLFKKYEGYTLEETEKPEGAHIVNARPPEPMDPFALEYRNYASMYEPFINVRHSAYYSRRYSYYDPLYISPGGDLWLFSLPREGKGRGLILHFHKTKPYLSKLQWPDGSCPDRNRR